MTAAWKKSILDCWIGLTALSFIIALVGLSLSEKTLLTIADRLKSPGHDETEPCLLCGATRGSIALVQGDFQKALQHSPILILLIAIALLNGGLALRTITKFVATKES